MSWQFVESRIHLMFSLVIAHLGKSFISQVFGALSQLECSSEVWERVLFQTLDLLADCNGEVLAATVDFVFKAALHSQHLPEAVSEKQGKSNPFHLFPEVLLCLLLSIQ